MSDTHSWWQKAAPNFLNDTLTFINSSRSRNESIGRCEELCKALNKTWNAYFQHRRDTGQLNEKEKENQSNGRRSDNQSFRAFVLHGLNDQQQSELCGQESLRRFAEFTPRIMNHATLRRCQYDPFNIAEDVRKKASDEHRQLADAYARYSKASDDRSLRDALLKKTAELIYIVRSNSAHSEKTPRGPDLEKLARDRVVSELAAKVIDDAFDILFDRPSHRLAVYGTLAPGEANQDQLAGLNGQWDDAAVDGIVEERDGFLEFVWRLRVGSIPIKMFSTSTLGDHLARLDRFEGARYCRILVPALVNGKLAVCNIYERMEK